MVDEPPISAALDMPLDRGRAGQPPGPDGAADESEQRGRERNGDEPGRRLRGDLVDALTDVGACGDVEEGIRAHAHRCGSRFGRAA